VKLHGSSAACCQGDSLDAQLFLRDGVAAGVARLPVARSTIDSRDATTRKTAVPELLRDEDGRASLSMAATLSPSIGNRYTLVGVTYQVRTLKGGTSQMALKAPRRQVVNVQDILTSICTKWGLLVLYALSRGTKRHGELRRAISGVSQKMLTQTLRTLERDRLVQRTIYPIVPLAWTMR
jgi:hypothetical protein